MDHWPAGRLDQPRQEASFDASIWISPGGVVGVNGDPWVCAFTPRQQAC